MPELPDVSPGATISTVWGNQIRDRAVMRYPGPSDRDLSVPTPVAGDLAYLTVSQVLTIFDGASWVAVANNPEPGSFLTEVLQVPAAGPAAARIDADGQIFGKGALVASDSFFSGAVVDGSVLASFSLPSFNNVACEVVVTGVVGGQDAGDAGFAIDGVSITGNVGDRVEVSAGRFSAAWRFAIGNLDGTVVSVTANAPGVTCFYRGIAEVFQT